MRACQNKRLSILRHGLHGLTRFFVDVMAHAIRSMHEVVLRVVAIAVRMVMAKCRIFCSRSFFIFDL